EPPVGSGQHLLDIEVPGVGHVSLLAEPAGSARPDGFPLSVRPVTRVQMAELFALVERLDEPSRTDPPPPEDDADEWGDGPSDDTMVDGLPSRVVLPTSAFVRNDSSAPSLNHATANTALPPPPTGDRSPSSVRDRAPSSSGARSQAPTSSHRPVDPRVGRVLAGKYQIDAPIGSGAAATVYRATHKDLRRSVAVKILHAENQGESQFIRRFKAEALTASKLEHVNVTRIIDFGEERGELYLVMELVNGRALEAILATEGPLPQRRVVDIGIQVSRALVFAHAQGVIHRDIKPENVMIVPDADDDGEPCDLVKVCDFGLAKLRDPGDGDSVEITVSGMLCGSPAYMSPEQTRGDTLDARTDVYSLGVTLFEALTGALPYEAYSIGELFLKKCTANPRRVSELVTGIDPLLDDIVARAMAIDPNERHESARELRTELRTARDALSSDDDGEHATIHGG
ncbi:MAG: Serine/threonine protein kinase PrkC, regulator of stationary phase, partial [Labilithrix sp.]|nr:Serine/threonine protein kinase PrkC, regulator of stationary phase [Labilithrix sp.]